MAIFDDDPSFYGIRVLAAYDAARRDLSRCRRALEAATCDDYFDDLDLADASRRVAEAGAAFDAARDAARDLLRRAGVPVVYAGRVWEVVAGVVVDRQAEFAHNLHGLEVREVEGSWGHGRDRL